ncbi:hypothetical protein GW891_01850, partial [bacterium]|nr:hypothetical protein [bacterium]
MIFGKDFLSIDWFRYGFKDPSEMCYSLGAYIANIISFKDDREVSVLSNNDDLYFYQNNIHGDFRLIKYDLSNKEMLNPLNPLNEFELLPFSRP